MKFSTLFLCILFTISCKKNNNSIENVFLQNLKESIKHYEELSTSLAEYHLIKNEESGRVIEDFNILIDKSKKIKTFMHQIEHLEKENQIIKLEKFISELNLKGKYKFMKIETSRLQNLSNETSFYYIKNEVYKKLYLNICDYASDNHYIYCGYTRYSDEKTKLMDQLRAMEVQEFKNEICNPNSSQK